MLLLLGLLSACGDADGLVLREARQKPPTMTYGDLSVWIYDRVPTANRLNPLLSRDEKQAICGGLDVPYIVEKYGHANLLSWSLAFCTDHLAYDWKRTPPH